MACDRWPTVCYYNFKIDILLVPCLIVVSISILINILCYVLERTNNYLSDKQAFFFLLFDTCQLSILLYLTGGIYNPFSILLIAPIIISASYLPLIFSIILSTISVFVVVFISFFYVNIDWTEKFLVPKFLTLGLIISIIFITMYVYIFAKSSRGISKALEQTKNALFNQRKISDIGSLSAAAVHELSTPLNTIFLVLNDLLKDPSLKNNPDIKEEINLLKSQADRCKEILLRLSKNPQNLTDNFYNQTTLSNIIQVNLDKFNNRNISINKKIINKESEPVLLYKDELMYGIGNIIQNALQHAKKLIKVNISWTRKKYIIQIIDDGTGFSRDILNKIGGPYISNNKDSLGLGIFISINLIENIGGKILFKNNVDSNGSTAEIHLNRNLLND